MPLEHRFVFPLPNGLHARPASQLEAVAAKLTGEFFLHCERNGHRADLRSVLGLIAADIRQGDACVLQVEGADEAGALAALVRYLTDEFPSCDEALPVTPAGLTTGELPRVLAALGVARWLPGQPLGSGLALAPLVCVGGLTLAEGFSWPRAEAPAIERQRLDAAISTARSELDQAIRATTGQAAEVLRAHASILADRALTTRLATHLDSVGGTAGEAVLAVSAALTKTLRAGSAYLQERVADLQDVAARLLIGLYGEKTIRRVPVLTRPSILVAADLTPGQFLALDRRYLLGLVLEHAGSTSHTVILARAAGLPLLVGVSGAGSLPEGTDAILDGRRGLIVLEPENHVSRFYSREAARLAEIAAAAALGSARAAQSADGTALPLYANVATAAEVGAAVALGAEGIGLFRTELLFMDRPAAPDEEEQYAIYAEAVRHAGGRPLVIRTLDIGGDKPIAYLDLPVEPNPFLGTRGVRLYAQLAPIVRAQLRALLRASAHGPIKIMVPMIACPEEMADFRAQVEATRRDLLAEGLAVGESVAIGAMLEIPSAVFALPELARHADFFSVGSNDLAQYFLAADRDNASTAALGTWKHPAFLRFLRQAVDAAHAAGRPIGLCGDLASRPEALPVLFALGFDSLSQGAAGIAAAKVALARLTREQALRRLDHVLAAADRASVESALSAPAEGAAPRLLVRELFQPASTATTKAEVINELVAMVDGAGRTRDALALEEAVWTREQVYATNFGHGFAVPHCQTAQVAAPVIALVRLPAPLAWGQSKDNPVRIALLLAMPAGENRAHLQIFARISRLIMRDEFRAALEAATDAEALRAVLADALEPQPVVVAVS
jgi:phosphoenolpyruvate-protein phosphotransferase